MSSCLIALLSLAVMAPSPETSSCSSLKSLVHRTYGFRPSLLTEAARDAKAQQMDAVWQAVQKNPTSLVPCLKAELAQRPDDAWFQFDAGQLLVSVDPSRDSKLTLLAAMKQVSLDDVDPRTWVQTASSLGRDGFDTSDLGRRWLTAPQATYSLPEHGGYEVDRGTGAMFIFGAMDERYATPALSKLSRILSGEAREVATGLLMSQATKEALQALKELDPAGLSAQAIARRQALLEHPTLIEPREPPKTTRKEFLAAFQAFVAGDPQPFDHLVEQVPDGERDVVAVCTPEDVELLRRVRRYYIARSNQHAIDYYNVFSQILMTFVWRADAPAKAAPTP